MAYLCIGHNLAVIEQIVNQVAVVLAVNSFARFRRHATMCAEDPDSSVLVMRSISLIELESKSILPHRGSIIGFPTGR